MNPTSMSVEEIVSAAQALTFEERKKLIHALFTQMPKPSPLAGSVEYVADWEEAKAGLKVMVAESLVRKAAGGGDTEEETP